MEQAASDVNTNRHGPYRFFSPELPTPVDCLGQLPLSLEQCDLSLNTGQTYFGDHEGLELPPVKVIRRTFCPVKSIV